MKAKTKSPKKQVAKKPVLAKGQRSKRTTEIKAGSRTLREKSVKTKKRVVGKVSDTMNMEKDSRLCFQQIVKPWNCINIDFDNGSDFYVELITNTKEDGLVSDHRTILVQHKSESKLKITTKFVSPKPVETKKILQWYYNNTQIPYLFVVNNYPTKDFYYIWIDSDFINQLEKKRSFWTKQATVSFTIPKNNLISESSLKQIKQYVFSVKPQFHKIVEPGTFFKLKNKVTELVDELEVATKNLHFTSVDLEINELKNKADNALYRIAITGLSRFGKSSLINTLVKRKNISPTDIWQTTGVPIQIHPSEEEKIVVNFLEPELAPKEYEYSEEVILEYATRKHNRDNHKRVSDVCVYINSNQLERGVMFYDIPGLDDPNDEIMGYAYHTADCANAILYVIDGSSAAHGSFVFSNQYKSHINKFSKSNKDKIFLVVNKVDALTIEKLRELKAEISDNLENYDLKDKLHEKVYYLAVDPKNTDNYTRILPEVNTVGELENDMWKYMLGEDRVGIFKLCVILNSFGKIVRQLEELVMMRSSDSKTKKRLQEAMDKTNVKVPAFNKYIIEHQRGITITLRNSLDLRKQSVLVEIENRLRKIPLDKDLPSDSEIRDWGVKEVFTAIRNTNEDFGYEVNKLKEYFDQWIEDNLEGVREVIDLEKNKSEFDISQINNIELPKLDFSSTFLKTLFGAIAGAFISPYGLLFFGTASLVLDLVIGKEHRRDKKIKQTIEKLAKIYDKGFADINRQYETLIYKELTKLINYGNNKLKAYFSDINSQINGLKLPNQIDYSLLEDDLKKSLKILDEKYGQLAQELNPYALAIKPSN